VSVALFDDRTSPSVVSLISSGKRGEEEVVARGFEFVL
jgi:hypothetical protein